MINLVRDILNAGMPFDKGYMFASGLRVNVDADITTFQYDYIAVPYIIYQNEGFTHWISGRFIDKNIEFVPKAIAEAKIAIAHFKQGYDYEGTSFRDLNQAKSTLLSNQAITQLNNESG